jgi:hypothetical protein
MSMSSPSSKARSLHDVALLRLFPTTEIVGGQLSVGVEAQIGGLLGFAPFPAPFGVREQVRANEHVGANDDDDAEPALGAHFLPGLDRVVDEAVLPLDQVGDERIKGDFVGHGSGDGVVIGDGWCAGASGLGGVGQCSRCRYAQQMCGGAGRGEKGRVSCCECCAVLCCAVLCFEVISKSRVLPSTARPMNCSSSGLPRYWLHTTRRAIPGLLQPSIPQARK